MIYLAPLFDAALGTRVLDRIFATEWEDYERLYDRVNTERQPLTHLREKVGASKEV